MQSADWPTSRIQWCLMLASVLSTLVGINAHATTLEKYVQNLTYPGRVDAGQDARTDRGAVETTSPPVVNRLIGTSGQYVDGPVDVLYRVASVQTGQTNQVAFFDQRAFPCRTDPVVLPAIISIGTTLQDNSQWRGPGAEGCGPNFFIGPPPVRWQFTDSISFGEIERRTAVDGAEFDAAPMVIRRNDVPWITYYWGYRLGLVASKADWDPAKLSQVPSLSDWFNFPSTSKDFNLVRLPVPRLEDDVVEYVNRTDFPNQPGGQFFYAVLASDKAALDAAPNWSRTGKSFKSGGYVSVCRFYGGKNGGPNTHFYSADDKECTALKAIPQLSYEGQTFAINMPMPAKNAAQAVPGALRDCPVASKPLYRVYNNASNSSGRFVSNHRYLTERSDVTAAVAQGWVDEGHVMCVPL